MSTFYFLVSFYTDLVLYFILRTWQEVSGR